MVTLTDRPNITMDVFDALVNPKTTSGQQLLYYDFVSAAVCSKGLLAAKV